MGGMRQTVKENNAGCYSFYGAASAASHTLKETNTMLLAVLFIILLWAKCAKQ
jgi:hypothetical protein